MSVVQVDPDKAHALLKEITRINQRDSMKTTEINILVEENRTLQAKITKAKAILESYGNKGRKAVNADAAYLPLIQGINSALKALE